MIDKSQKALLDQRKDNEGVRAARFHPTKGRRKGTQWGIQTAAPERVVGMEVKSTEGVEPDGLYGHRGDGFAENGTSRCVKVVFAVVVDARYLGGHWERVRKKERRHACEMAAARGDDDGENEKGCRQFY